MTVRNTNFADANAWRQADAAARDAAVARAVLDRPLSVGGLTATEIRVARARLDYPGCTWAELAACLGVSKDTATGTMRRIRDRAAATS